MTYFFLTMAVLCEVVATSCLKASNEFREWVPSLFAILGYVGSLYFMTLSLRKLTLGTVYATWSGLGIVLVAIFGFVFYKEKLDFAAILGIALIIAGVLIMNLVSKTNVH